ncbi:hypothetical protein [Actinokineospora enzanensis]|uniref:hypothetical protein n=1 Tax=Actinokineospora enzanensis TaxID=155975 RepID=UPI0003801425|nr:hypothetical protein [Actinokineospora enzanensis]
MSDKVDKAVLSLSMLADVPSIAQAAENPSTPESTALAAAGESGRPVSVMEETTETAEAAAVDVRLSGG